MMQQMMRYRRTAGAFVFMAVMLPAAGLCQEPTVKTTVTANEILIGGQLQLKVKALVSLNEYTVNWFKLPDTISHFEVVDAGKLDTVGSGNDAALQQTITLTSFDSGSWTTPPFAIACKRIATGNTTILYADSMPVNVSFAVDTVAQLKDIKPIFEVRDKWPLWYYLAGAGVVLLIVLLAAFLYWYLGRKKKKNEEQSALSPYNEAMEQLDKLQQPAAADAESVKLYYTKLADILKRYISRKGGVQVKGHTTGELLLYMTGLYADSALKTMLATVLRCSDAVKFARYLPPAAENEGSLQEAKKCIEQMEKIQNSQQ
jgi:cbb3-type cytochrome oxidase subunit 3